MKLGWGVMKLKKVRELLNLGGIGKSLNLKFMS